MLKSPVDLPSQDGQGGKDTNWSHTYMRDHTTTGKTSPLAWWYALTAPPEPGPDADFTARDAVRRGLLASSLIFCSHILLLAFIISALFTQNIPNAIAAAGIFVIGIIALGLNRRGHVNIAGAMLVIGIELGIISIIGNWSRSTLFGTFGLFDILVLGEIFAASLLPVNGILFVAIFNVAFIVIDIAFLMPLLGYIGVHTRPDIQMFRHIEFRLIIRPVILHVVVTIFLWLWMRSATKSIRRADRAASIAALEHSIAEQEHTLAEEKRAMDVSVQKILHVHQRASGGDFSARVPIAEGEPLWRLSSSLNNLLNHLQRLPQMEREFQHIQAEALFIAQAIEAAEAERRGIMLRRSGTVLDPLAAQLHGKYLVSPKQQEFGSQKSTNSLSGLEVDKRTK